MQRLLIAASLIITGCASSATTATTPQSPSRLASAALSDPDPDVHCTIEIRTGTHLSRPICRSEVEIETDRIYAQELVRQYALH